jgi:CheY-like chemotaxis protein
MMSAERFTVLVVNDEPLLHRILHASLRSSGFVVEKARTAEEALAVMRERTFEVALLYINILRANGVDFCRQMRAPGESIGIVMVSAQDVEKDMVQALESGKLSKREWMKFREAALHKRGEVALAPYLGVARWRTGGCRLTDNFKSRSKQLATYQELSPQRCFFGICSLTNATRPRTTL